MSTLIELKVPDIGGHSNVDVIEVFIKAGDSVAKDDALVTLETDKATMDVPADAAGVVKEVKIAVGSKVSEGDVIALIEASAAAAAAPAAAPAAEAAKRQTKNQLKKRRISFSFAPSLTFFSIKKRRCLATAP
jgi:pyruvate/2-oxoglutarate dehydrogenase complex dihydrolipoamide acyltransferase (E2) component